MSLHGRRARRALWGLFYKVTKSHLWGLHPHDLTSLSKAYLLILSPWRLSFNIWILEGHIQSIAVMQGNVKIILNLHWFIQAFPSALIFYTARHQELNIKCNTTEKHSKAQGNPGAFKIPFIPYFRSWLRLAPALCWKYPSVFAGHFECYPCCYKTQWSQPSCHPFHQATVISCNKYLCLPCLY